jgi:hypothetical protein
MHPIDGFHYGSLNFYFLQIEIILILEHKLLILNAY